MHKRPEFTWLPDAGGLCGVAGTYHADVRRDNDDNVRVVVIYGERDGEKQISCIVPWGAPHEDMIYAKTLAQRIADGAWIAETLESLSDDPDADETIVTALFAEFFGESFRRTREDDDEIKRLRKCSAELIDEIKTVQAQSRTALRNHHEMMAEARGHVEGLESVIVRIVETLTT